MEDIKACLGRQANTISTENGITLPFCTDGREEEKEEDVSNFGCLVPSLVAAACGPQVLFIVVSSF